METLNLQIVGVSPLLMNNPASMSNGSKGVGTKKIPTPEEEAALKVYRHDVGGLFIPSDGFRRGIIKRACSGRRIGKRYASAVVPGALFLLHDRCDLVDPDTGEVIAEYEIDTRRAVIQGNGVLRSRPRVEKWATILNYEIDTDFLNSEVVLELQNMAGKIAGVGDYRPEKTGPFGRYTAEVAA